MVAAIACGTPVIAFGTGSVLEVVDKQNRVLVNDKYEMIEVVKKIGTIDRKACRETAFKRFDVKLSPANTLILIEKQFTFTDIIK